MPQYAYRARDNAGQLQTGFLEAPQESSVVAHLRERNLYIVEIKPAPEKRRELNIAAVLFGPQKVKIKDLAVFCRQFATIIEAGIPILQALHILTKQAENKKLKKVLAGVVEQLEGGRTLAESLKRYQHVFPNIFISMVEAGELGGVLDQALSRLADHFEKEHDIREKVKSAMTYPVIIVCLALAAVAALLTLVLPKFITMLTDLNVELPLSTKIVMSLSNFLRDSWYLGLLGIMLTILVFRGFSRTPKGMLFFDSLKLKLPVFGKLTQKVIISRCCRTLSTLLHAGVPILVALEVVKKTAGNQLVSNAIAKAEESVREGLTIADPLERSGVFPPMVTRMMAIGENAGTLDYLLERVAVFYDREVNNMVLRLSSMLEPFLIITMGLVIGFIVISMLLPMLKIFSSAGMTGL
ncbi:type II secretion system F family protein [Desulforamulus ferrireducens]|uniref:Type II secretion system protein F n=1 Tax=Desulforamulus ferrireducens TaxID=1833852 RepID=A0A1S6IUQ5_9FIRM|nr:type II secretion system F family protein [Desulforamulus ferrireducens]AQS58474.1 type II secretion system protein F [Desulforamulus ferrireducens]